MPFYSYFPKPVRLLYFYYIDFYNTLKDEIIFLQLLRDSRQCRKHFSAGEWSIISDSKWQAKTGLSSMFPTSGSILSNEFLSKSKSAPCAKYITTLPCRDWGAVLLPFKPNTRCSHFFTVSFHSCQCFLCI